MHHILNNSTSLQLGGTKKLGQRLYISAFTYVALLLIYSLESAAYLKGEEQFKKLKKDDGFFAIFIAFRIQKTDV